MPMIRAFTLRRQRKVPNAGLKKRQRIILSRNKMCHSHIRFHVPSLRLKKMEKKSRSINCRRLSIKSKTCFGDHYNQLIMFSILYYTLIFDFNYNYINWLIKLTKANFGGF